MDIRLSPSLFDFDRDRQLRDARLLAGVQDVGHALKFAGAVAAHEHAQVGVLLAGAGQLGRQFGERDPLAVEHDFAVAIDIDHA